MLNGSVSSFFILLGVVEYLSNGGVADNHKDFKELRYNECLMNFSCNGKNGSSEGRITHGFQLKSAYENNLMPYTNYTFDFKVSDSLWVGIEIMSNTNMWQERYVLFMLNSIIFRIFYILKMSWLSVHIM